MHANRMIVSLCSLLTVAASAFAAERVSRDAGLRAFDTIRQVLQHPRCQNCHIPGDAPLQFDEGLTHFQNVQRGVDGHGVPGLTCGTCHAGSNPPESYGPHAPPGAPNWHLPPPNQKMVFIGLAPGTLCNAIKDPSHNGNRTLDAMLEHVSHDELVLWGWNPGGARAPVSVSHEEFVDAFERWMAADAPCPST